MALWLILLILVGVPLVELYLLIEVGSVIGALPTVFLTVFTAVLGGLLVRAQGFATLMRIQAAVGRGEVPAVELIEGAVLLVAGVMLLLPGFFTDALGFLLLVPVVRRTLIRIALQRARIMRPGGPAKGQSPQERIIEGEFRREDD